MQDVQQEAIRIVNEVQARGVILRLLGGLAIRIHAPSASHRAFSRSYPDMDFATPNKAREVERAMAEIGYGGDREFNLLNGASRLIFYGATPEQKIDVFVGSFEMCHKLPITERIAVEPLTLPLAELLLTKLQIVQINEKDLRDVCALLLDHPVGSTDGETINADRVAELCAKDWGLWRTITFGLDKVTAYSKGALDGSDAATIATRVAELRQVIDTAPKSIKWKTRSAVGERVRWYELPEEVERD
jgi:hypothetical protein